MYFVFNKSHMFVRLNLVANLMYVIYVNNTLPLVLAMHEITRHFWAAYRVDKHALVGRLILACVNESA